MRKAIQAALTAMIIQWPGTMIMMEAELFIQN